MWETAVENYSTDDGSKFQATTLSVPVPRGDGCGTEKAREDGQGANGGRGVQTNITALHSGKDNRQCDGSENSAGG